MTTRATTNGNDHDLNLERDRTDSTAVAGGSAGPFAAREQPAQTSLEEAGMSDLIIWPHFNIGADGRAYV
jgi:hypothetical protein